MSCHISLFRDLIFVSVPRSGRIVEAVFAVVGHQWDWKDTSNISPTLLNGRDFILNHTGNTKKILFGTQTEKDASALRERIEELGELKIIVEVVVLEMLGWCLR